MPGSTNPFLEKITFQKTYDQQGLKLGQDAIKFFNRLNSFVELETKKLPQKAVIDFAK